MKIQGDSLFCCGTGVSVHQLRGSEFPEPKKKICFFLSDGKTWMRTIMRVNAVMGPVFRSRTLELIRDTCLVMMYCVVPDNSLSANN